MTTSVKLFRAVQEYMQTIGVYPSQPDRSHSFNTKNISFLFCLIIIFFLVALFFLFESKTPVDFSISFYCSITSLTAIGVSTIMICKIPNIVKLVESIEEFIEKRIDSSNSAFPYSKLIENIELLSKFIYLALVKVTIPFNMIPALLITMFNYYIQNLGDESFFLPFPTILPLGWVPPFGYFICWCIETAAIFCIFSATIPHSCLFLGGCWLSHSIIKDISSDLSHLNRIHMSTSKSKSKSKSKSTSTSTSILSQSHSPNDQELKVQLCSIVKLFSDFKEIMCEFNAIGEFLLLIIFYWSLLSIIATLLVFLSELSIENLNSNPMGIITPLSILTWSFAIIACTCECGERVTEQFFVFNDKLNRCKWYSFPLDVQRILLVFMGDAQQPAYVRSYGNILCTRNSFKETVHGGFSYFMLLRQVDG